MPIRSISLILMGTLLMSPLPALGESFITSGASRDASLLALDLKDIIPKDVIPNVRQTRRKRRIPKPPKQRPTRDRDTSGSQGSNQVPQSPFPKNTQPNQPQAPVISPQEQQFLDSLSPDEQQFYKVIQRAKRTLRQQINADALGLIVGMSPKGVTQSPQDLDREFQTILRDSRKAGSSEITIPETKVSETKAKDSNDPIIAKSGNQLINRLLNRRSNETHEQWHARIDPLVFATPSKEYEAWRATLSSADKQAYDSLTQQQRQKQSEEMGKILQDAIRRDLSCQWVTDPQGNGLDKIQVCDD